MLNRKSSLLFLSVVTFCIFAVAERKPIGLAGQPALSHSPSSSESPVTTDLPADLPDLDDKPLDKKLIEEDIKVRKKIDDIITGVDLALTGGKLSDRKNLTQIVIRNQLNWPEGGPFVYTPHLDLRLDLPNLEKKFFLKFATYNEDQESRGINRDRLKTSPIQDDAAATIGVLQKLGEVQVEFEPRVEFRSGIQLSYFMKLTSSSSSGPSSFHPDAQFFARSDTGIGQFLALNFDVKISRRFILSVIDEEQYQDQTNLFSTNNGLLLTYIYNDRMSQQTSLIYEASSRPAYHLDSYTIGSGFTHKLYRNVLHYTILPYLIFPRNLDFKWSPGLNLEVDIIF